MKKIIAISVMFALVAGAVFADVSLGGGFGYKWDVVKGTNGKTYGGTLKLDPSDTNGEKALGYATPVKSATEAKDYTLTANFSGDNYGGKVKFYASPTTPWWTTGAPFAFAWWKPVDMFRFQLGHNADGDWGAAQITGWGFNASAQDYVAVDNDSGGGTSFIALKSYDDDILSPDFTTLKSYSRDRAWRAARAYGFYPGFGGVGALFSLYPVDILTVNIALPVNDKINKDGHANTSGAEFADVLKKAHLNVVAKVGDIGTARLSFVGQGGTKTTKDFGTVDGKDAVVSKKSYASTGDIYASFYLAAIENLGLDVGFGYHLPFDTPSGTGASLVTTTKNDGIDVGVGVTYKVSDDFGVKARIGAKLLAETKAVSVGSTFSRTKTNYGIGILPYYNLGGATVYFNAGFGVDSIEEKATSVGLSDSRSLSYTDWYVNPYVKVPAGGLTFWAGLKVIGDTMIGHSTKTAYQNGGTMEWALPIGISVGF